MTNTEELDRMADAWAFRFDMRRCDNYDAPGPLQSLFLPGRHEEVADLLDRHSGGMFLDHPRAFRIKGARRCSAVVSAPREDSLLKLVPLTPADVVDRIYTIAEELELRVRIGHPADRIYVGTGDWPTLPIAWWDPKRVPLAYPKLETRHAGTISTPYNHA